MNKPNSKIFILIGGIVLLALFWVFALNPVYKAIFKKKEAKKEWLAYDFSLKTLGGQEVRLNEIQNKIIIVNFWASWCPPCIEEFPSLVRLVKQFNGKVVLLAISVDEKSADVEAFLKKFGTQFSHVQILRDPNSSVIRRYGTSKLPESYILNPEHKMIRKVAGSINWMSAENIAYFKQLIESSGVR